jgi:aryl-alcohol dehydrogenase-like predicted oxidoreductase
MSTPAVPLVALGSSGIVVSSLALGSWRTFERMAREDGVAVLRAARDAGITFLDDARYDDETGSAPMPSGYSEVVFGELFRGAGWPRAAAVVANKLWWEFWPAESAAQEIAGSLGRMGLDYVDLIYAALPPEDLPLAEAVEMTAALVTAGMARAWGTLNWPPALLAQACEIAARAGVPPPAAAQLPYSLMRRHVVEDPRMQNLARQRQVAIVASHALAGGALTGKYDDDPQAGRLAGSLGEPKVAPATAAGRELAALARATGRDPAQLALAFALTGPSVTAVLFGATRREQVAANVAALAVAAGLTAAEREQLAGVGRSFPDPREVS